METRLSELQEALRAQARAFLEQTPTPSWPQLVQLGWPGVALGEELGGAGLGLLEEAVLHEEAGRALVHGPFWSTARIAPFLPEADRREIAAGAATWALADGPLVPDLDTVTRVAVLGGDTVWELEGATREVLPTVDATRPLGVVVGGDVGRPLFSSELLPRIRERTLVSLAFEALGVGDRALEVAIAHARERHQFGRPLGSYQAVAHPLADRWVDLELARSLAWWAAWATQTAEPEAGLTAVAAKAAAADACVTACEQAVQTLGGVGFTWESPLQRLLKRALWIRAWEGTGEQLRAEVAAAVLDTP
jgi:alkylation response protein AidB-like acyl-CoA dehydrogenase